VRMDDRHRRAGAPERGRKTAITKIIGAAVAAPPPPHQEGKNSQPKAGRQRRGEDDPCKDEWFGAAQL